MVLQESLEEAYKADCPTDDAITTAACILIFQALHDLLSRYYEDALEVKGVSQDLSNFVAVTVPRPLNFVAAILRCPLHRRPPAAADAMATQLKAGKGASGRGGK